MPGKAAKVVISERQQVVLRELSRSKSEGRMIVQRATIILRAFEGVANEVIAKEVQLERKQVGVWRRRWQAAGEALTRLECQEPRQLREAIRETLRDAPRSGSPGRFTAEQIVQIIAVACEPPEKSGRPITHWTHRELRDEIIKRLIVDLISESHLGTILSQAALKPHRRRMWLNTKEKDPVVFAEQVAIVCQTYLNAPQLHAQRGVHTVSTDEMTGIQALERNAPSLPLQPGQVTRDEFESTRHGTTTRIANHDVVTGECLAATIGPTRTEEDYIQHIKNTVALDPDGEWIFIKDCLNIHWSAGLVEWIASLCAPKRDLGEKRDIGNSPKPSQPPRVPQRSPTSHPLRVSAQTELVAQSDRDRLRHHQPPSRPSRPLHLGP